MGNSQPKLTKREQEILILITEHYLTAQQLVKRLGITKNRVYVHIRNLRKKGYLTKTNTKNRWYSNASISYGKIRLHGQQFRAKILYKSNYYKELVNKSNVIFIDNNTIRLHRDSVNIYLGQHFIGDEVSECMSESLEYFRRFITRLEYELKIRLVKSRYTNIKLVSQHFAKTEDELSKEIQSKGEELKIFSSEDGKLWLTADNSFNLKELESVHSETSELDMSEVVVPFFNDLRDNGVFLPSMIKDGLSEIKELLVFGSRVKILCNKLKSALDVFIYKEEIDVLSIEEKAELTRYLCNLREKELYGGIDGRY